jgi:hypothetical protein
VFDLCDGVSVGDAMAMPRDDRQQDLLRPALEAVIDLGDPLVRLAREIDSHGAGQPPLLVAGLLGLPGFLSGRMTFRCSWSATCIWYGGHSRWRC